MCSRAAVVLPGLMNRGLSPCSNSAAPQPHSGSTSPAQARLVAPLRAAGITSRHALLRFPNPLRKPGPVFNFMMAAAAEDGAEYLYRVNDDTEYLSARGGDILPVSGACPPL